MPFIIINNHSDDESHVQITLYICEISLIIWLQIDADYKYFETIDEEIGKYQGPAHDL